MYENQNPFVGYFARLYKVTSSKGVLGPETISNANPTQGLYEHHRGLNKKRKSKENLKKIALGRYKLQII